MTYEERVALLGFIQQALLEGRPSSISALVRLTKQYGASHPDLVTRVNIRAVLHISLFDLIYKEAPRDEAGSDDAA